MIEQGTTKHLNTHPWSSSSHWVRDALIPYSCPQDSVMVEGDLTKREFLLWDSLERGWHPSASWQRAWGPAHGFSLCEFEALHWDVLQVHQLMSDLPPESSGGCSSWAQVWHDKFPLQWFLWCADNFGHWWGGGRNLVMLSPMSSFIPVSHPGWTHSKYLGRCSYWWVERWKCEWTAM